MTRFKPGDRVISTFNPGWIEGRSHGTARTPPYRTLGGAYPGVLAEYVAFSEDWFSAAPASLSNAEASTLPVAGLTAWFALVERGAVRAGQTVVVQGTGGVALFGLQIAKAHGAQVLVTSRSADKLARVKALGADHGIDQSKGDWVEEVYRLTDDRGADHILEIIGGANLGRSIQAVAVHGRISVIGVLKGFEIEPAPAGPLLLEVADHPGDPGRASACLGRPGQGGRSHCAEAGHRRELALADLAAALDHLDRGPFGKIVLELG